jgi:outer membrane protein assembly factor BamA
MEVPVMNIRRHLGRWALAALVSALAAPTALAQTRREVTPRPEVARVDFVGVSDQVDLKDLQASIYTEPTRCRTIVLYPFCRFTNYRGFEERHYLDRTEFQRDVIRIRVYYYRIGFREATVDTSVTVLNEKQVAVRFEIHEGPPTMVSAVDVVYDSTVIPPKKARDLTLTKAGDRVDLFKIDSTRINFQNELWERGYADALIDTSSVVDENARTARVRYQIVPNRPTTVGEVVITGTEHVAPTTVLNTVTLRPGDLFKRSSVLESQRNLYESNLFRLAVLDVPQTFDSVKTVNILVREAPLHEARTSVGFNSIDYLQTEGRFTHYNLLGGARRLDISATLGNLAAGTLQGSRLFRRVPVDTSFTSDVNAFLAPNWHASIDLKQPAWLQRPRNALGVGVFAQRNAIPSVVIDRSYGGNVTFTRTLALRAPASLGYRFEVARVEAGGPYYCVDFGVCDTVTINTLRSHQRLSPLLAQVQIDRSDQPLNPTRGYTARGEIEHASQLTMSDYRYNRLYGEGAIYSRLGWKKAVLAAHMRIGFVRAMSGGSNTDGEAILHPRKRFYAGGAQSVRGYGENQLGPRVLTLPHEFLIHGRTVSGAPCDPNSEAIRFCDPNFPTDSAGKPVGDDKFTPRALGGTSLLEGSVEYRMPLPFLDNLQAAVFVDGAAVGERALDPLAGVQTLANFVRGTWAITPGFGIRYLSSVGPIRMDLGFNPSRSEELAVVTELTRNGHTELIPLDTPKRYSPMGNGGGIGGILNRFTLHLSIGQAY